MYNLAFKNLGISVSEAEKAFQEFVKVIPPFTEEDILAVHMNPSLSFIEKHKLIRKMRKQMKGDVCCG